MEKTIIAAQVDEPFAQAVDDLARRTERTRSGLIRHALRILILGEGASEKIKQLEQIDGLRDELHS